MSATDASTMTEEQFHRRQAVELFNHVWDLLEKAERTDEESDAMIHAAHASRHHWAAVGTVQNLSIGEWQIARVYAVLGRAEPALYHAERALRLGERPGVEPFCLAWAHEALARGHHVAGNAAEASRHLGLAREAVAHITDDRDRQSVLRDLASITLASSS